MFRWRSLTLAIVCLTSLGRLASVSYGEERTSDALFEFKEASVVSPLADIPEWIGKPFQTLGALLPSWDIPLRADSSGAAIAVTLYYKAGGGWARLLWSSEAESGRETRLIDENSGVPGQVTFLIPSSALTQPALATLQTSGEANLYRMKIYRIYSQSILASESQVLPGLLLPHLSIRKEELLSETFRKTVDEWSGRVITAPLLEQAETVASGTEIFWELERTPSRARVSGEVAGLGLDENLQITINEGDPIPLSIVIPDLTDAAHFLSESGPGYAGWRKVEGWIPVKRLTVGPNSLRLIRVGDKLLSLPSTLKIRGLSLQLDYMEKDHAESKP